MSKYLDQAGLKKVVELVASKIKDGLSTKVSSIATANADHIAVDVTDPLNPKISLGATTGNKIESMWSLTNNGTGLTVLNDAEIDQIFADTFK